MQDISGQVDIDPSRPSRRGKSHSVSNSLRNGLNRIYGKDTLGVMLGGGELKGSEGGTDGGRISERLSGSKLQEWSEG